MPSWASSVSELSEGDSEAESSVIITPDRDIRDGRQSQRLDIQDIVRWQSNLVSLVKNMFHRLYFSNRLPSNLNVWL